MDAQPCRFYLKAQCRNGQGCPFSHAIALSTTDRSGTATSSQSLSDTRSLVPCQFYLRGKCRNGEKCVFAHTGANAGEPTTPQRPTLDEEEDVDGWVRDMCGTVVRFGDGAHVRQISHLSNFSAVHLGMIPVEEAAPLEIVVMLARLGFTVPVDCVVVRSLPRGEEGGTRQYCGADVQVEDPSFAKNVCARVAVDEKSPKSSITAVPIYPRLSRGSSSYSRVGCKKVHCSWHRPSRAVWLNFGNRGIAQMVGARFDAGAYRVLKQQVASSGPTGVGSYRNRLAWTLVLKDVPGAAREADIIQDIPSAIRPRHVELGSPSYEISLDRANGMIKSQLENVGPLELWEDATEVQGGKRAKVKVRFQDEDDARRAANILNQTPLPFNPIGKLTLQVVYTAKLKVSERIYSSARIMIEQRRGVWKSQHLLYNSYEPIRGHRVLKLEGENSKNVAKAKKSLEQILAGRVVMYKEKALWNASFATVRESYDKFKEIEKKLSVIIVRNKRQAQLRVHGLPENFLEAEKMLVDLAIREPSTERTIPLDPRQFLWACRGGFKAISTAIGDDTASFDITSTPKRILVTGPAESYQLALKMVSDQEKAGELSHDGTVEDCAICGTEAENMIRTQCKHTYCADCFEAFCFYGVSGSRDLYIRCQGDSGNCMIILPLAELQEHLTSTVFEEILEAAFKTSINRSPQRFRYCPTPDCNQVYRVTSTAHIFTCSDCLVALCTTCHLSHEGMTCAEHKDELSGGYKELEKMKQKLGIKDCPKCKTSLEKVSGCDHMICFGCKTHICWKCMQTFSTSDLCYAHMTKSHGSIGLAIPDEV